MTTNYEATPEDINAENNEWLEAIDAIRREQGDERSREMLRLMQDHLLKQGISLAEATLNKPYRNTISPQEQPPYPGDIELEQKIENIIRWNAMANSVKDRSIETQFSLFFHANFFLKIFL